jgi:ATP-dependent Clp protease ATP-binding subunit ClpB
MTSNIGSHLIQDAFDSITDDTVEEATDRARVEVMNLLRQTIRPEFLNRVDEIIMFRPLLRSQILNIVKIQLDDLAKMTAQNHVELTFSDYLIELLAEQGYDPQFGARPLKRLIQKQIVNALSKKLLSGEIDHTKQVLVDAFDGVVVFRNE